MRKAAQKLRKEYKPYIDRFNRHPFAIPVTTFLVLFIFSIATLVGLNATTVRPSDTRIIELSIDDTRQSLPTRAQTVGEFLRNAEIELGPYDRVEPAQDANILSDDFKVNVYRARPVTVIDGQQRTQAYTAATTPRSVASQVGITVYPEDRLNSEIPESFLRDGVLGEKVVIERATPVQLNLYGEPEPTRTHARTVKDLLDEKEVTLGEKDKVKPALDTRIEPNLQIFVVRDGIQIATTEEEIPMPLEIVEDASLSFGSEAVRQQGSPGRKTVTYEIKLRNGQEVSRRVIQEAVITQPVTQIVARGPQGSFGQALALLRQCESSGNYSVVSASGTYMGAYQFNAGTWRTNAPPPYNTTHLPHQAPPQIQDIAATNLYQARGWQPWPACSSKLGLQDVYR